MGCSPIRVLLFRELDGDLSASERRVLQEHLAACPACAQENRLLSIPRRIGKTIPLLQPPPFFYSKLRARLESETQSVTIWQIILGLSRHLVPALAAVTLALLSVFAYLQIRGPQEDVIQAYDRIFQSGDRPQIMMLADQGDINDESVLRAIAEDETQKKPAAGPDQNGK